jgi:hypothetical protein
MRLLTFHGKGSKTLLWGGSRALRGKRTISSVPNCLNYCEIFMVYIYIYLYLYIYFKIYKYCREPRNTIWQVACWEPRVQTNLPDQLKNLYIQHKNEVVDRT